LSVGTIPARHRQALDVDRERASTGPLVVLSFSRARYRVLGLPLGERRTPPTDVQTSPPLTVGAWGVRWIGELGDEDLDPKLLLWDMHRNIDHSRVPAERTVVHFRFTDAPTGARNWWLVITPEEADVCDVDPGHPVAVAVTTSLRTMVEVWRGDLDWSYAVSSSALAVDGATSLRRSLPKWFRLSAFATVPRPS
jgi:hypothetical protein